ncbi:DNA adenine methylase [Latilactobacillus graminis]|uniref:site-specific DNA-methyltransferase (adenine-specific) n=1 Tax=Latilactobacillus graminis TaxID=60519 RepID=A0ABX6CCA3_9LACO|nr:DNA adenine methylase [Latilactobacillus graminis]
MKKLPQLFKWVGNKHRFADEIISYMPDDIQNYYEPFLGSGAVLGHLAYYSSNVYEFNKHFESLNGSDIMTPVVDIFNIVKNSPDLLVDRYAYWSDLAKDDRKIAYQKAIDSYNNTGNPLDFFYVSRSAYSAIIRFRKDDGFMSTPIGPHTPISTGTLSQRVDIWHDILTDVNTNFRQESFEESFLRAREGDLIYCDPPYTHSQTILYGAQAFLLEDLWDKIEDAKARNVRVMVSLNSLSKDGEVVEPPRGLFERDIVIDVGKSMIDRLQNGGRSKQYKSVNDKLLLTW